MESFKYPFSIASSSFNSPADAVPKSFFLLISSALLPLSLSKVSLFILSLADESPTGLNISAISLTASLRISFKPADSKNFPIDVSSKPALLNCEARFDDVLYMFTLLILSHSDLFDSNVCMLPAPTVSLNALRSNTPSLFIKFAKFPLYSFIPS